MLGGPVGERRAPAGARLLVFPLLDDPVAVGRSCEDAVLRTSRLLLELVRFAEVVDRVGIVDAVVEGCTVPREPRVDAVPTAVPRAIRGADERVAQHFGLPAGIGDDGPVLRVRAVTKRGVEDPDRLEAGPVVVVERAAERLTWNAERTGMVAVDVRVAELLDE